MHLAILVKGIMIGFSVGAVVGPIGVLCIRRTLASGFFIGFMTGIGAAIADAVYGGIAAFGLTSIADFLVEYITILQFAGGSYLLYLGYKTFKKKPSSIQTSLPIPSWFHAIAETFLLTMTNPITIFAFAAIYTSFELFTLASDYITASTLTIGVFFGSCLWWLLLSSISSWFRTKITANIMHNINRLSGIIIFLFGCYALIQVCI